VEGDPLIYDWSFISRPPESDATVSDPTAVNPTFYVDKVGTYVVQLIVNDGTDTDSDILTIVTGNFRPVADAGSDQTVLEKSAVTLDGSESFDRDDGIDYYLWKQISGPSVTLSAEDVEQPTFTAPAVEEDETTILIFELTVADQAGQEETDSTTVPVTNFEKKNPGAAGGGCFIATASYGSPVDSHVMLLQARIFHELLSRDREDGRACPPSRACSLRRGGRATGQLVPRYRGIGSEAYLNGTSQGPTPEDARKDAHIRGRSR
jgi:hypothetical protein